MIYCHDFQLQSKMHVLLHLLVLKSITQYLCGMEVRPEDTLHMAVSMCQAFYALICANAFNVQFLMEKSQEKIIKKSMHQQLCNSGNKQAIDYDTDLINQISCQRINLINFIINFIIIIMLSIK